MEWQVIHSRTNTITKDLMTEGLKGPFEWHWQDDGHKCKNWEEYQAQAHDSVNDSFTFHNLFIDNVTLETW